MAYINKLVLGSEFKTCWNPDKYIIFINGRLLNKRMYRIFIPSDKNDLKDKVVYFNISIKSGSSIDVYYIECDDNFDQIPFNKDVKIFAKNQYAEESNQTYIQIPYPYDTYPRDDHTFFVFTDEGKYLDQIKDYSTSYDKEYITLRDRYALKDRLSFITFVFPYVMEGWEMEEGEVLDEKFKYNSTKFAYSYSSNANKNGIVEFSPVFEKYKLTKDNFILFGNTTYISPERYDVLSNSKIQFKGQVDKDHCVDARYTMIIFEESATNHLDIQYNFKVYKIPATQNKQLKFKLPDEAENNNFLLFKGSVSLDEINRYYYSEPDNSIIINNPDDYFIAGRNLYCIIYKPLGTGDQQFKMRFNKAEILGTKNNEIVIPEYLYNGMKFYSGNMMLFVNGTYIEPDRYIVSDQKIKFNNPPGIQLIGNGLDSSIDGKAITIIYLKSYTNIDKSPTDSAHLHNFELLDNDFIYYEESHAKIYV